jgi:hypothetical protein
VLAGPSMCAFTKDQVEEKCRLLLTKEETEKSKASIPAGQKPLKSTRGVSRECCLEHRMWFPLLFHNP